MGDPALLQWHPGSIDLDCPLAVEQVEELVPAVHVPLLGDLGLEGDGEDLRIVVRQLGQAFPGLG